MIAHRTQARRRWLFGGNAPEISISPSSWDFGSTPVGTPVSKQFTISNTGTAALQITLPITSDNAAFTITVPPPVTSLAPGASTTFTAQFSGSLVQTYSGSLSIVSNAASSPTAIAVTATATIIQSGLVRDWDFSDTSKLYESTDTSDPAEANDPLGLVVGQITGNLGQATLAQRPLRKDAIQNGKTVGRFDATDFMSLSASLTNTGNETIFVVCKHGTTGAFGRILGITGTAWGILYSSVANRIDYDYNGATATKSGGFTETDFVIITARYNGTNNIVRVNGLLGATSGSPVAASHTWNTVAARAGGNDPLNGDMGRVIIYNTALSDAEVLAMEAALAAEWGVSI